MAGASERAGFIEAPVTGPPNIASRPTVPPIAIAAASPTARVSVAAAMITNIRKKVSTSSHRKLWPCDPEGRRGGREGAQGAPDKSCGEERAGKLWEPVADHAPPREVSREREGEADRG